MTLATEISKALNVLGVGEKEVEIQMRRCPILGVETKLIKIEEGRWMCVPKGRCMVVSAGEMSETTSDFKECYPYGMKNRKCF